MEALRRELEKKRKAVAEGFGEAKYVKRAELEKKKLEQIKKEEEEEWQRKQRLLEELQRKKQQHQHVEGQGKDEREQRQHQGRGREPADEGQGTLTGGVEGTEAGAETAEERIDKLQLPRGEVIRRLRLLKHPVTLFGEDDDARLARLKHIMKTGDVDPDGELLEGQRNDFLRDIIELKRGGGGATAMEKGKKGSEGEKGKGKRKLTEAEAESGLEREGASGSGEAEGEGAEEEEEEDIDAKRLKAAFDDLCAEDKILVFFKKLLKEWKQELDSRPDAERRTIRGKKDIATYKQCARYLDPMFKMCRRQQLYDDIRDALLDMVNKCRSRDYLAATDRYIKLAIGNAPWPIGVTMVGIHERSAREKIHTNSVAHIMNDETTRKYLQSVKRLMTFCQRCYPALPSKSVEFNSLANGSDLEALLKEEARKGGQGSQEALLRLTAAKAQDEAKD